MKNKEPIRQSESYEDNDGRNYKAGKKKLHSRRIRREVNKKLKKLED